ncbi:uncharacterized protein RCC_09889 [Ramularia collo-cygni]|uniref:DUF7730 domain-containing protein n=1 Tax=Ramularia collo-cygni TaxID=112498 RepID=A0A2D3VG29_9PEZI|nr:uncharacterized protein RCC_09889 [Ramularia collo-cygni]CZT24172.1 uncharacterized protein RCC_09889 [Ramularia collo-cygni]
MAPQRNDKVAKSPVNLDHIAQAALLLRLPTEVKNKIIFLVCIDTKMDYRRKRQARRLVGLPPPPVLRRKRQVRGLKGMPTAPFLMTCKQLYAESVKLFYARATFNFANMTRLHFWLDVVKRARLKHAKHVFLEGHPVFPEALLGEKAEKGLLVSFK